MPGQERNPFDPTKSTSEAFKEPTPGFPRTAADGNRPATGARQATPGEVLAEDFSGGQNAGDFLGLDLEFDAGQTLAAGGASAADFYGLDLAGAPGSAPAPAAPVASHRAGLGAEPVEADPSVFPESGEDALPEEELEEAALELDAELEREAPGSRRGLLIGVALAVGLVAVLGAVYGEDLLKRFRPQAEVAQNTRPPRNPAGEPAPGAAVQPGGAAGTSTEVAGSSTPVPVEDLHGAGTEVAGATPDGELWSDFPNSAPGSAPSIGTEDPLEALTSILHDSLQPQPTTRRQTPPSVAQGGVEPGDTGGPLPFEEEFLRGLGWAKGDSLHMSWAEAEVPMDAMHSPARVMMPRVGPVRIHMDTGEVFEGRLVAMGEERVWIDTEPGRIGLDGTHVTKIDRLPESSDAAGTGGEVATGHRVRLRVPGGVLYGRVLTSGAGWITVVTEDGAKITVSNPDVEEVGSSRVRLVTRF